VQQFTIMAVSTDLPRNEARSKEDITQHEVEHAPDDKVDVAPQQAESITYKTWVVIFVRTRITYTHFFTLSFF
jgi:hypothetical protein